eukprot:4548820-Prymnesium_polylepis.1
MAVLAAAASSQAVLQSALSADRDLRDAMAEANLSDTQVARGASMDPAYSRLPPYQGTAQYGEKMTGLPPPLPPQQQQPPPEPEAAEEEDAVLREVMEELRLQEAELARIRGEEREIERMLRASGAGMPARRREREPMPSARD